MRATVVRDEQLVVDRVDDPEPGDGHVLARSVACGICGSDLHALQHLHDFVELTRRAGGPLGLEPGRDVVFGHEYCAEIVDFGPNTQQTLSIGTRVCSPPMVLGPQGPEPIGYSHRYPGGFGELMVLQEALLLPVPDGVSSTAAALTEPLAVGEHAVVRADISDDDVCLVIGCGPIGLAVIAGLKARGQGPVLAADFSPSRRSLAEQLGADEVIDPATLSPFGRWSDLGVPATTLERGAADMFDMPVRDAVIFEAVGNPGVLQTIIDGAAPRSRIVVVGVCMQPDQIEPSLAVTKELDIRFAFGYSQAEFAATLGRVAETEDELQALVTATVGLDGVAGAFRDLREPDHHVKILVTP
jgi:threonine dehydrogenase-like Zn-dependent dehydrogenase